MSRWAWAVGLGIVGVDQALKFWAVHSLSLGESRPLLGQIFRIARVHNSGAAFGLFPTGTTAFLAVSVTVAAGLFLYLLLAKPTGLKLWGSTFILGGTLGNLIDRARLGHVVDLFSLGNFPVFNLADAALVVGVGLLALGILRGSR